MTSPLASALARCTDPTQLMALAGVQPPSPAIATCLRALYAARPVGDDLRTWASISRMPWPRKKPRRAAFCVGRRGLKTSGALAWSCAFEALCVPHGQHARTRVYFVVVCPRVEQAAEALRAVRDVLLSLAPIGVRFESRDPDAPELVVTSPAFGDGVERVIKVMVASDVSVRGFAIAWCCFDEAGFLPFGDTRALHDKDILRAIGPGQAQFPQALMLFTSSPGAPGGAFHAMVERPGRDVVVVRAPTWTMNPRITEAACMREAGGDLDAFEQEFAARKFGYGGESFIDTRLLALGDESTGKGPREGFFVVGLDVAQIRDQTAIVCCSGYDVEVSALHAPVRHVVVEHAEVIESSKREPTPIEAIAQRVAAISNAYGRAPVVHDLFAGPTVKAALARLGMHEHFDPTGEALPPLGTFTQCSMDPSRQTPRWRLLRSLAQSGRLHLGAGDEELRRQLAGLRAVQLSSGALRVDGKRDDQADALALAAPIAAKLPPTDGPGGRVEFLHSGARFDREMHRVDLVGAHWVRVRPDGSRELAECPRWSPLFDQYAEESIAMGISTPAIREWQREREQARMRGIANVTIVGR
jgi:hypothetical protein